MSRSTRPTQPPVAVMLLSAVGVRRLEGIVDTAAGATPEVIADYTGFDFESLWSGREKVTRIEEALLRVALGEHHQARVLELGTGFGRLTPALRAQTEEYVGVDFDPRALARARGTVLGTAAASSRWVLANLHHLPFSPGSFSAIVMVRVAHHLPYWEEAVRSAAELLQPGGRWVVTVAPTPTIGTLAEDVKRALRGNGIGRSSTLARGEDVQVSDSPHPIYVGSRKGYRRAIEGAGLNIALKMGSGLEELVPGIPAESWVGLAAQGEGVPWFPTKWYAADRAGDASGPLPPIETILACPRCRRALPDFPAVWGAPTLCAGCGFAMPAVNGLPDLRYVPENALRVGPVPTRG
jgi:SAM-dependent methyltransferase